MANPNAGTRQFIAELSGSCTLGGSNEAECRIALPTESEYATASSSAYFSALEERIESSKSHWSELADYSDSDDDEVAEISNVQVFDTLGKHPIWGTFFVPLGEGKALGRSVTLGRKFAEGVQAELYEAKVHWCSPEVREDALKHGSEYVMKVFKTGSFLKRLQFQWPRGLLQFHAEKFENVKLGKPSPIRHNCDVLGGFLLEDGRFGFLMNREEEDLRSRIDQNMLGASQGCGPFSKEEAELVMCRIALGMNWLHNRNIVHRDLKASNVLISKNKDFSKLGNWACFVADFECSIGVVGTGFFRAPEILQALKDKNISHRQKLFTKEADVYSYGMTCYEILTGKLPFEGHSWNDYDLVLNGQRPEVPGYVHDWTQFLLNKCWESNPANRPSFEEIIEFFAVKSIPITKALLRRQAERNVGA